MQKQSQNQTINDDDTTLNSSGSHQLRPDATSLLGQIRAETTTAEKQVKAHLQQLNALQPALNAAVKIYQQESIDTAIALDRSGEKSLPLFGLPCSVKETFAMAGEELTAGSIRRQPVKCTEDAEIVRRLRAAGAIIIARSNIPEFAMTGESTNPRFGRCNNPHDTTRVAGGSTGGEGALVGSGSTSFGVGSDILGSIRIPAALCGTVGFKARSSAIDGTGTWPTVTGNTKNWLAYGPITRSVRDAQLIYNVIADTPIVDTTERFKFVSIPEGFPVKYRQACIQEAVIAAKQCLLNNSVESKNIELSKVPALFLKIPKIIIDDFYDHWISELSSGLQGKFSVTREFIAQLRKKGTIDSGLLNWLMLKPIMKSRRKGKREKIADEFNNARVEYQNLIGPDTVLVLPTLGLVAPKHKWFNRLSLLDPRVNGLFTSHTLGNYLDLPSIAIPAWKHRDPKTGLPASVSLMCAPGAEDKLFEAAKIVEAALN